MRRAAEEIYGSPIFLQKSLRIPFMSRNDFGAINLDNDLLDFIYFIIILFVS